MNKAIKKIVELTQGSEGLTHSDKQEINEAAKAIDTTLSIADLRINQLQKEKRTITILLEETIEELEHKRKTVEAQNRKLEIEGALERVRSEAMGMKLPDDLLNVCKALFYSLWSLQFDHLRNALINYWDDVHQVLIDYDYSEFAGGQISNIRYSDHPVFVSFKEKIKNSENSFAEIEVAGEDLKSWIQRRREDGEYEDERLQQVTSFYFYFYSIGGGSVGISSFQRLSFEQVEVLRRFRNVFELCYRRYLDIKKAEAQAREAQIEAALEKVRSRSLAMHRSEEVHFVMDELLKRLNELEIDFDVAAIIEFKNNSFDLWTGYEAGTVSVTSFPSFDLDAPYFKDIIKAKNSGQEFFSHQYSFEEKNKFLEYLFENTNFAELPEERKQYLYKTKCYTVSIGFAKYTAIQLHSYSKAAFSEGENEILKRFVNVFEQAYTRFLDLQKAEAQAREAQIESALERVRSRAMAMQKSEELAEAAQLLYKEFSQLAIKTFSCGYMFINEEQNTQTAWVVLPDGTLVPNSVIFPLTGDNVLNSRFNDWKAKKPIHIYEIKGEVNKEHHRFLSQHVPEFIVKEIFSKIPDRIIFHCANFSDGYLLILAEEFFPQEHQQTIIRFANVFEMTYTRFLDLKKAEAQAREANIEIGLERVRSRAMAMQTSEELKDLVATLSTELGKLDFILDRSFIMTFDSLSKDSTWWMSFPESPTPIGLKVQYHEQPPYSSLLKAWEDRVAKWQYVLDGDVKNSWDKFLFYKTELSQLPEVVKENMQTMQRVCFSSSFNNFGCLLLATVEPLNEEQFEIMLRFAKVFDLTYTRFNDLKIAEAHALQAKEDLKKLQAEKKRAEEALKELRATQNQLIQAEKMASLGELTAGIAHEIQNPLNFVNNFSEVSSELLQELKEEIENKNYEDVITIADDVKNNLSKILHHGKRADAIVKGMLLHSRNNSGEKEATDINALTDEYIRLAYHGLRAKDKLFNATLKTDYDENISKINIVPQDIGRVILNIVTNAFYAVSERALQVKPLGETAYEPTVTVSTKKEGEQIFICIKDNGGGIPQKVLDKIFQPFFSTKPTGEGTGLGLSISYDIVKAHGGELKVKAKEGEGAEFIFSIPMKNEEINIHA